MTNTETITHEILDTFLMQKLMKEKKVNIYFYNPILISHLFSAVEIEG